MSAEPTVSQRLFDEACKRYDDQIGQLRASIKKLEDDRKTTIAQRIAGISAGAAVIATCITLLELWHSSGR